MSVLQMERIVTAPKVAADFLDYVEQSRLLTPDEVDAAVDRLDLDEDGDPATTAQALVTDGLLTRLQATRLLAGHTRGFFIDQYRIEDVLGSGGMGWVYIARDVESNEQVALKMLCEQGDKDAGLLTRFRLEAQAGMRLDHPAIVRTRKIGSTAGLYGDIHYTVMDFFPGIGVDEFVAIGGPIKWPLTCHIVRHVAAGLHHAHLKGLIHRDVKPANILVDTDANARILDFGLSLASQGSHGDEFSLAMIFGHDCLGTADYIAPEQAQDSFTVDQRADIYSLGATMFFMLAGRTLFPDRTTRADRIHAQVHEAPPDIRQLRPEIPEGVAAILSRMLAKDPEQRFQSAKAVCVALEPFAKLSRVLFDFQKILDRRSVIAQQRRQMLSEQARRTAEASSLTMCSLDSRVTRPSQSAIETAIRRDTELPRSDQSDGSRR